MSKPTMRILSLGAGVQSTVLALMACDGTLPGLDAAIFADTGWEPQRVYDQVDRIEEKLKAAGITLYRVSNGNIREDSIDPDHRYVSAPYFYKNPDGSRAMGRRQCTSEYKITPINRKVRELLGAAPPDYRYVPRDGRYVEQWIGFSYDEIYRMSDKHQNLYTRQRFPLIELKMDRRACQEWLQERGWGHTAKSACIGCPYSGNRTWREMRDTRPDEWAEAIAFDRQIRKGARSGKEMTGEAFLHRSLMPLDQAPIDRVTPKEYAESQLRLFAFNDSALWQEEDDPEGCSPYSCRSGEPVFEEGGDDPS